MDIRRRGTGNGNGNGKGLAARSAWKKPTESCIWILLVAGDVKAFVDLHFVGVDDLCREACGEVDGEFGFSDLTRSHLMIILGVSDI